MDFNNRLKGKTTQSLLETLLEDADYSVVPLGIEEVVREVKSLKRNQYLELGLPMALRKLPDFFISNPDFSSTWLVEVKYRMEWSDRVRDRMAASLLEQVQTWEPVYLVLFLGENANRNDTPANYLGVCELGLDDDGVLGVFSMRDDSDLGEEPDPYEVFTPWDEVTWGNMRRFQDVFSRVGARWQDDTLFKAVELMKNLGDL